MTNEEIVLRVQRGDDVQNNMLLLFEKNAPLIKKTCSKYSKYENMDDLLQVAFLSLYESTKRFNDTLNCSFISYCLLWVKQCVTRYINQCCNTIRVPEYQKDVIEKYKKIKNEHLCLKGKEPSDTQLCEILEIDLETLKIIKNYAVGITSIDKTINNEELELSIVDVLPSNEDLENETINAVYSEFEKHELWNFVERNLTSEQAKVITERFKGQKTYTEISKNNKTTLRKTRNIEEKALYKLRLKKKELYKLDLWGSLGYRGGFRRFKENDYTSCVEEVVLKRAEFGTSKLK